MATPNHRLRNARLAKGLTQRELAHELDVSHTTLQRWEKGVQDPYLLHQTKLSRFFEKDLSELGFDMPLDPNVSSEQQSVEVKSRSWQSPLPVTLTDVALVGRG